MVEPPAGGPHSGSSEARERAAELIGRVISDRYRIVSLVGMGGMGAVYRAEHLRMRKHVAIKVLHPATEGFPELVARFEREAVAGAHIEHPNVVTASDFGEFDDGSRFLVLEFVRGTTLKDLMERGPLPAARAASIVRQVAAALGAVHQKGIVHRDLKPRNIMIIDETRRTRRLRLNSVGAEDVVKLIDFGLAKVPVEELSQLAQDADNGRRSLTAAGVVMGTVGYLAPETAMGMRSVLAPADLYSLGVIFYEMLSARHPFDGSDASTLFQQHRMTAAPPIAERNPEVSVPARFEAIVRRLLEKDPDNRYRSAGALVQALDAALAGDLNDTKNSRPPRSLSSAVPTPPTSVSTALVSSASASLPSRAPAPRSSRTPWLVALLLVVVAGVAAAFAIQPPENPAVPAATGAVPSSAHSASAAPRSGPVQPVSVPAPSVMERLRAVVESGDPARATSVLGDLADQDPAAFSDRAVQTEAAPVVELAARSRAVAPVFDRLGEKLGTGGLDILYDLVVRELRSATLAERGGMAPPEAAGPRARAYLARPGVLQRASPAMRIAYELLRASCGYRVNLFARAATDGDDRALQLLTAMQPPACSRRDRCCLENNRELDRAVAEIQARIRR